MEYDKFDKLAMAVSERRDRIINCLKKQPLMIKELRAITNLEYCHVSEVLQKLQRQGIVIRKRFGVKSYYGLIMKQREVKDNERE